MSIDCAFFGFVAADADARTSKAGKAWTRLRVGVGKDDEVQWVSVAVFGKAAESAAGLKKSDRCYVEGTVRLDTWQGKDGVERHGLSVAAFTCERTHEIGRNRLKRDRTSGNSTSSRPDERQKPEPNFHNDDIPF